MDLRKWDPTTGWKSGPASEMVVDLEARTLMGVRLGEPLERLSALGRAEAAFPIYSENKKRVVGGIWHYLALGLTISALNGKVEDWCIEFVPVPAKPDLRRFVWKGNVLALDDKTTESDLTSCFGAPYWRGHSSEVEANGEFDLFYEIGGQELMFEMSDRATLRTLWVHEPTLASEEGRQLYQVTCPWPPP